MRILVTGAAGFIGYHLCKALIENGFDVVGLDNLNDYYDVELKFARLSELGISRHDAKQFNRISYSDSSRSNFLFVRMNLEDRENLPLLFSEKEGFDVVINLAAQAGVRYSLENPETYIDSNVVGFLNVLECCRKNGVNRLLYASSSSVYGQSSNDVFSTSDNTDNPISLYAATKKSNELMASTYSHLFGLKATGLRFFTVYGPYGRPDMAIYLFTKAIFSNKAIKIFNNGDMSRDFTYIDDIISGIILLLEEESGDVNVSSVVNVGNGAPQSLMDFVLAIEQSTGIVAKKNFLPMQPGDVPRTSADLSELKRLGYQSSTGIREGVEKFVNWYKKYYDLC